MERYSTIVQWSDEDNAYIAFVPELPGLSAFGSTREEALGQLDIAQKDFLDVMKEDGEALPEPEVMKPFSGQTRLRLPKSLHASLVNEARLEGISFNTYVVNLLSARNSLAMVEKKIDHLQDILVHTSLVACARNATCPVSASGGADYAIVTKSEEETLQ